MPSGPKKRLAARRRSIGARTSLDKESVSGSHASDEGTSPKTYDDVDSGLSFSTGGNDRPTDQSFQTEEWVRVSDFGVGTPTAMIAKNDFHISAEGNYGGSRGRDKIVDWETISRENVDNFSSVEDVGESRDVTASSYGLARGQGVPHDDNLLSDSSVSDKEDDAKSVKSRGSSRSSSSSSSCSSRGSRRSEFSSDAYPKKSDDEERLSNLIVVPSHGDDSQESSFLEVASVDTRDDDYHEIIANIGAPERKEDKHEVSSGVEDQAVESAPSEGQMIDENEGEEGDAEVRKLEHQAPGQPENEDHQVAKLKEFDSEMPTVKDQVSDPHAPDHNLEHGSAVEDGQSIEPTTPDKASEKSFSENPYSFDHSISDEEILEEGKNRHSKETEDLFASLSAHEQTENVKSPSEVHENISIGDHDSVLSSGVPEPDSDELNHLLEIAHSKEMAELGKVEQRILSQEHDARNVIADLQPLVEGRVDSALLTEAVLKDRNGDEHQSGEVSLTGDSSTDSSSQTLEPLGNRDADNEQRSLDVTLKADSSFPVHSTEPRTAAEGGTLVLPADAAKSEQISSSSVSIKGVEASCMVGKTDGTMDAVKSSESSEQIGITSYQKREGRLVEASSGSLGCCEPLQWLLANFTRWVNPPAIRN